MDEGRLPAAGEVQGHSGVVGVRDVVPHALVVDGADALYVAIDEVEDLIDDV